MGPSNLPVVVQHTGHTQHPVQPITMGRCLKCGCGISTFLGLPALCTGCAKFESPVQKQHLDTAAVCAGAAAITAATGGAAAPAIGLAAAGGAATGLALQESRHQR